MSQQEQNAWSAGAPEDDEFEALLYGDIDNELEVGAEAFLAEQQAGSSLDFDFAAVANEVSREMTLDEARSLIDHGASAAIRGGVGDAELFKPPLSDDPAEVVALVSSLKGMIHSYYASLRLQHFLARKRIKYVLVDINKDVIHGRGLKNSELVTEWSNNEILQRNSEGRHGISVGDEVAVQDLEEDGDFDHILNRARCPHCLADIQELGVCAACARTMGPIIPPAISQSGSVYHMFGDDRVEWDYVPPSPSEPMPYFPVFRQLDDLRPDDMLLT